MTRPEPGRCSATRNHATGERCGSPEIAGFVIHVTARDVAGVLDGSRPDPDIYLQPQCAEHLARSEESDQRIRDHGPSQILIDVGFVGSAVGTVSIIRSSSQPN